MAVPFVNLKEQYHSLKPELDAAALDVLESTQYILGEQVRLFEQEVAAFCGVRHTVGVNSGTDALLFALKACSIGKGDEVITASNSFFATAEAIALAEASPVFVDISPDDYLMDPELLQAAITPRTRAIIPVHLYGQLADMEAINAIARRNGIVVIEDACQAIGALRGGKRAGSFGDLACFSFVPAKNLGGYGDGGMIVTNNDQYAETIRTLRDHGSRVKYYNEMIGYNSRLDSMQAAFLRVKLPHLDRWNRLRRERARLYTSLLQDTSVICPQDNGDESHIYHLYVVRTDKRDALMKFLKDREISTLIHYPIPIHMQSALEEFSFPRLPITEALAPEIVSLPMFPEMTEAHVHEVALAIMEFDKV